MKSSDNLKYKIAAVLLVVATVVLFVTVCHAKTIPCVWPNICMFSK